MRVIGDKIQISEDVFDFMIYDFLPTLSPAVNPFWTCLTFFHQYTP